MYIVFYLFSTNLSHRDTICHKDSKKQAKITIVDKFYTRLIIRQAVVFSENITTFVAVMKNLLKNLGLWILVAMVAGVVVGAVMGADAKMFAPLGSLFIQLIKMLVVPLVGISIISGAASLGNTRSAGRIGVTSIAYILLTTVVSIVIAIVAGLIFKPGAGLSAEGVASIISSSSTEQGVAADLSFWDTIIGMIPTNPIQAFAEGNILQIIVFGLFLGFGILFTGLNTMSGAMKGLRDDPQAERRWR